MGPKSNRTESSLKRGNADAEGKSHKKTEAWTGAISCEPRNAASTRSWKGRGVFPAASSRNRDLLTP